MRAPIIFLVMLCGCAAQHELKVIDVADAKHLPWAKPKAIFAPNESFLAVIRGYGGCKVNLELWRCGTQNNVFLRRFEYHIPARRMYRSYDGVFFDTRYQDLRLVEQETFYWTSTGYVLRFKPLAPGIYELRLSSDDGRKESARFTMGPYR